MLLDTHVWAWSLTGDPFVSAIARERMDDAQSLILSSVSFYEISHKVRLGKWPQMAPLVARLVGFAQQQSKSPASSANSAVTGAMNKDCCCARLTRRAACGAIFGHFPNRTLWEIS